MNRKAWLGLPLAFVLGCHHNLVPDHGCAGGAHGCAPGGGAGAMSMMPRRFANVQTQLAFVSPVGMSIGWEAGGTAPAAATTPGQGPGQGPAPAPAPAPAVARAFLPGMLTTPGRFNFDQGAIYRLKLTNVPGHTTPFYPTIEVAPSSPRTDAYLSHNAVPIEFTDEDFDQVSAGNFVTKVIYLPDPLHQELAIAGVETLVSTRLDPGVDPIAEADRRGTILVIVRLGGIDLEMPQVSTGATAPEGTVIQMANTLSVQSNYGGEIYGQATVRR